MHITAGQILAQRFFDVADEIDLARAEQLAADLSRGPRLVGSARQLSMPKPPLDLDFGARSSGIAGLDGCRTAARIYNVGTVVITFAIDIPTPISPEELICLGCRVMEAESGVTQAARVVRDEVMEAIAPACKQGDFLETLEDYTVFSVWQTEPPQTAEQFRDQVEIARLLMGEPDKVSDDERNQATQVTFSYFPDELVVVDWNSALVLDPRRSSEVPFLLEMTTTQLVGLRSYDDMVGRALDQLYNELDPTWSRGWFTASSRYQKLSRRIMQLYVDVAELTDRVDNSLEFLGDTWLARIHRAAVREFDIHRWQAQLKNKMEVLRQINGQLVDQIMARRTLIAEYAIVALIVLEILFSLFDVH